jgi:hypothetical protein
MIPILCTVLYIILYILQYVNTKSRSARDRDLLRKALRVVLLAVTERCILYTVRLCSEEDITVVFGLAATSWCYLFGIV